MKETDLYEPIKDMFEGIGYDVYAEVIVPFCKGRIDIVAASPPSYTAVEMKTTLSVDLIGQAMERKAAFPLVYIAIPHPKRGRHFPRWLIQFLKEQGIGMILVNGIYAEIYLKAKWRKPIMGRRVNLAEILKEEHKTWAVGGTNSGGYVTPYRLTMVGVKHYLAIAKREGEQHRRMTTREVTEDIYHGWRTVTEILEHCETHYATPKASLAKALLEFEDWVEAKKVGRKTYFRLKGDD